jgi:hypothetical protein
MKIYLVAVVLALASAAMIVSACMTHESSKRAVPISIAPFR